MKTLPSYHETLHAALAALTSHLIANGIEADNADDVTSPYQFDGIPYGTSKESHFEIKFIKGKATRKWGHVTIWRSDKGRYEINYYSM